MSLNPEVLANYIDELGLSYTENSLSYIFDCYKCSKHILYCYKATGRYQCMKCADDGVRGRPEYLLAELTGISLSVVLYALYGTQFIDTTEKLELNLEDFFGEDDDLDFEIIPEIKWAFDELPINHKHAIKGLKYLEGRGIHLEVALKYKIRYAPVRQRVLFPLEVDGRLLGHQDRIIVPNRIWSDEEEKFKEASKAISTDNLPTSRMVMFSDNLKDSEHAIIAEGPVDGIKFDLCGGNIATMGKAVSKGQIAYIRSKGIKRIYLALDRNAYKEATKLASEFEDLELYHIEVLERYDDFGAMSFTQCLQAFKDAKPVLPGQLFVHFN